MKKLKLLLTFCLFSLLLFTACKKDPIFEPTENVTKTEIPQTDFTDHLDLSAYSPKFTGRIQQSNFTTNESLDALTAPSETSLDEVVTELLAQNETNKNLDYIFDTYGNLLWDYSLVDSVDGGSGLITIPFAQANHLTALLTYIKIDDEAHFKIYTKAEVEETVLATKTEELINDWFSAVSKFLIYEQVINDHFEEIFNDWVMEVAELRDDQGMARCAVRVEIIWWGYIVSNGVPDAATSGSFEYTYDPCAGASGSNTVANWWGETPSNDDNGTGGGSNSGDGNSFPSLDEIVLKLELTSAEKACLEQNFSHTAREELQAILSNDNDLYDQCDSGRTEEEIIADLIASLCASVSAGGTNDGPPTDRGDIEEPSFISPVDVIGAIEEDECVGRPLSCHSFNFESFGLFQVSQLIGEDMNFGHSGDPTAIPPIAYMNKKCKFNLQTTIPTEFFHYGTAYPISAEGAAEAAADAINAATRETVFYFGQIAAPDFANLDCEDIESIYTEILNIEINEAIKNVVNKHYDIDATIFDDADASIQIGFDELGLTPTYPDSDWGKRDQCWN